ncbi:Enolase protein [Spatholobus suberectus]|nr:Enolase protein [Spatholobus suberectus]
MKKTKKDVNRNEKEVEAKEGTDMSLDDGQFRTKRGESGVEDQKSCKMLVASGHTVFSGLFLHMQAVDNVNTIIGPALIGKDPTQQTVISNLMVQQLDGTINEWGWCKQKAYLMVYQVLWIMFRRLT